MATWLSMIVAARLLAPGDFGLVGMAQVFLGLVAMLSEFGLATAIIAQPSLDDEQVGQLNSMALLLGTGAVAVTCLVAKPLELFFAVPELPMVVVVTSSVFVISALRAVPGALLQKELKFRYIALAESAQAMAGAVTMVGLAVWGFRYWALVLAPIVGNLVGTTLVLVGRPCGFLAPRIGRLSGILTDSRRLLTSRLSWWVQTNMDLIIIGRVLGKALLGSYTLAMSIASLPVEKITSLVSQVSPPFIAAAQSDPRATRRLLLVLTGVLAVVVFPAAAGLTLVADEFVLVAMGAKWTEAILPLQLLSVLAAGRSVISVLATVVLLTGGIRFSMYMAIIEAFVMTAIFYGASHFGISGIAAASLLAYPFLRTPFCWVAFRQLDVSLLQYLNALWPALRATGFMVGGVMTLGLLLPPAVPLSVSLAAQVTMGVVTYALASLLQRQRLMAMYREFRELGRVPPATDVASFGAGQ
jgi:PST family polysaccharide transporter